MRYERGDRKDVLPRTDEVSEQLLIYIHYQSTAN
jgi:hypothetical protein